MTPVTLALLVLGGIVLWLLLRHAGSRTDVFNTAAETFPQQRQQIRNAYSIHWPLIFPHKRARRHGWINLIEPFRGLLVLGSPGSGKTFYVIRPLLQQLIRKGFTLFVYDFKYDDLTRLVYHEAQCKTAVQRTFHLLHFDDLAHSERCNPLAPATLTDISDASESARTILLGLNRDWIRRQGDFFVESAINLLTALIWFARKYDGGRYCTLPHVIELMQAPYDQLFAVLRTEPEIAFLINPFVSALQQNVMPQLEGQVAGAKISLGRLVSPTVYYLLSGHDFSLDINSAGAPKIVCMGGNPVRQQVYGALVSLYVSAVIRQVNRKGGLPCALVFDEFPTLFVNGIDILLATARSNKVATVLGVQDLSQLRNAYGRDLADIILNISGNLISGQVSGDTAHQLSERFGRIVQERRTTHSDTHSSAEHLDPALPPSRMATLSSGEFVGLLADNPLQPLRYKRFHGHIPLKHPDIRPIELPPLPQPEGGPSERTIANNFTRIREEVQGIIDSLIANLGANSGLPRLSPSA